MSKYFIGVPLVFKSDDPDAAIELASRIPPARMSGAVEVRPVVEWWRPSSRPSANSGVGSSVHFLGFLGGYDLAEEAAHPATS